MDLEKAKKEFIKYTNGYDSTNSNIARKIGHSIRVMEISKKIAKELELTEEEKDLATLIGLLHDIARFEQYKRYGTFKDHLSIDHGDLGVEILKNENFIRKFIEEDKYDKIIFTAIENHNKYKIKEGITDEELIFSKIIRDADKIDIFYEGVELFWEKPEEKEAIEQSVISEDVFNNYQKTMLLDKKILKTPLDAVMGNLGFIFDFNYDISYKIMKKEDYINKILNKFNFENNVKANKQIEEIRETTQKFIESKI